MRRIGLVIFLTLGVGWGKDLAAQCIISGELQNYRGDGIVRVAIPINGFANRVLFADSAAGRITNGKFKIIINCRKPVFTAVDFSGRTVYLVIRPKDSLHLVLTFPVSNPHEKVRCEFSGSNAGAQQLLYEYNYTPPQKYERIWQLLKANRPDSIVSGVKDEINRQIVPFDSLFQESRLTEDCYVLIKSTIAATLLDEAAEKIAANRISSMKIPDSLRNGIVDSLFGISCPLDESNLYGLGTFLYIKNFLSFRRAQRLHTGSIYVQPDTTIEFEGKRYEITGPFVPLLGVQNDSLREYFYAQLILSCLSVGAEEAMRDEMTYLKDRYPQSPYLPAIISYKKERDRRMRKTDNPIRYFDKFSPLIIDSTGKTEDFKLDKIAVLKGKLVFVDIWATWCGPCLEEMKYNYQLDSFLYSNNIIHLYISIDNPSDINKWRKVIYESHLGGYHILAGDKLKKAIADELEAGKSLISIPRFLVIKDADILIPDAFRPSDFEKLQEQLGKITK